MKIKEINEALNNAVRVESPMTVEDAAKVVTGKVPGTKQAAKDFAKAQKVLSKAITKEAKSLAKDEKYEAKVTYRAKIREINEEYTTPFKLFNKAAKFESFQNLCKSLGFNPKKVMLKDFGAYWNEDRKVFVLPVTLANIARAYQKDFMKGKIDEELSFTSPWFTSHFLTNDNDTFYRILPFTISALEKVLNRLIDDRKKDTLKRIKGNKLTAKERQTANSFYQCLLFDPAFADKSDDEIRKEANRRYAESLKHPEMQNA